MTKSERLEAIIELARAKHQSEGSVEIDDNAELNETGMLDQGGDNGCYVQAWVWVDFTGTPFDKEGK